VSDGKVQEQGSHDELIKLSDGRYRRLFDSSKRGSTVDSVGLRNSKADTKTKGAKDGAEEGALIKVEVEDDEGSFSAQRARAMARPDAIYLLLGSIGAVCAGGVFPMWYVLIQSFMRWLGRIDGNLPHAYIVVLSQGNLVCANDRLVVPTHLTM
jgi:ATP-binding cassette subfamily B (MDR/TAP) protein 1